MDSGSKFRIPCPPATSDAARLIAQLLQPSVIVFQDHVGTCITAAKGILIQAKTRSLAESLYSWSPPPQIPNCCGSFIAHAGRKLDAGKLEVENLLARVIYPSVQRSHESSYACVSGSRIQMNIEGKTKHVLSTEQVSQKLDGIPVYTVCNSAGEFVLISDSNNRKSLGIFCFRRDDAEAILQQVKSRQPRVGRGAKVVAVSLNKVYKLNADGIAFRLLPDPRQVKNALQAREKNEAKRRSFDGVPIFQSNNLIVRSKDVRFSPIFFCKEDMDQALQRASEQQQKVNPSLQVNTDIQVGSLEKVLKQIEDHVDELGWEDAVFVPPGMIALGQLE